MRSGLDFLHNIDRAISRARKDLRDVSDMPERTSKALADIQRKRMAIMDVIARERLKLIDRGNGGDLGYVDRQAEKLLSAHSADMQSASEALTKAGETLKTLESDRRKQEKSVEAAITAFDKAMAAAEAKLISQMDYQHHLTRVEDAESKIERAQDKLDLVLETRAEKSAHFEADPFFMYLKSRSYGSNLASGWFLTKWIDVWIARKIDYDKASETYRNLSVMPDRLREHIAYLTAQAQDEKSALEFVESRFLDSEGVAALKNASLMAQAELDRIDDRIKTSETEQEQLRQTKLALAKGTDGPYRQALDLMTSAMGEMKEKRLRNLVAQTPSRDDDKSLKSLQKLERNARDLEDEQGDIQKLLGKMQDGLRDLETVRQRYKSMRYDAPSSIFDGDDMLENLLKQVLAGVLSSDDLWRSIQRAQRTVQRYSDIDFGGVDWTDGLRLPQNHGGRRRSHHRRTSIPRSPRHRLPQTNRSSTRRSKGGFRTGGGF